MRRRWLFFLLICVGIGVGQETKNVLVLEKLIEEGLENNPQVKAFYTKSRADEARVPQAGSLPDPMVSLNVLNLPVDNFVFDQEPMTGKQLAVKQTFPFPGKLSLKESIARQGANVSKANWQELRWQLIRNIKVTYYNLFFIDQAIQTTEKNRRLLTEFVNIAGQKYAVGRGLQQDVLKAQVELSRMEDKLIDLRQKREEAESRMNALLNRPIDQPLGKTAQLTYKPFRLNRNDLEQLVLNNKPLFKAWESRIDQSREKVSLAEKQYWPDISVFAAYNQREVLQSGLGGVDYLSAGITLNIPLYFWRKQRKQVEETSLLKQTVEERYQNVKLQTFSALDNAISEHLKLDERVNLYESGIIPQATQALQSAMIGYQTDKVDFLTLVNNQMTLFNLELEYARILSDYNKNVAELEYLTGDILSVNGN